jgi:DNA-binding LacI/PurR family transcriptional regulator
MLKAADQLNLSVPDDLSLVGYGQNVLELTDPVPITAYVPETARIGEVAAELLGDMTSGKAPKRLAPIIIDGHLECRASVRQVQSVSDTA